ncbi:MAG: chromate transporter [Lachnospiraceae bacterium]|nr:chromate transporter [Lachnospiraceae bacterium]
MILLRLFFEFFKTGLFAIGGGLATLPFLREMSETTGWFTQTELLDMVAVSESTPGPIGVNMATYVGFTTAGIPGAVIATLGLITPSVIIVLIVAGFLKRFKDSKVVAAVFGGLRPASTALIAAVLLSLVVMNFWNQTLFDAQGLFAALKWKHLLLAGVIFAGTKVFKKWHPAIFLLAGAAAGIVFSL